MTLHEVMLAGRNKLRQAGVPSSEADIQWIVCAITHFNRVQLAINKEQILSPAQVKNKGMGFPPLHARAAAIYSGQPELYEYKSADGQPSINSAARN